MSVFSIVVPTHVLVGRLKNPNNEQNTPFVFATLTKEGAIMLRAWSDKMEMDKAMLFRNQADDDIKEAAKQCRDLIEVRALSRLAFRSSI